MITAPPQRSRRESAKQHSRLPRLLRGVLSLAFLLLLIRPALADDVHRVDMFFYSVDDSVLWYPHPWTTAEVDKLLLAPGEPVVARFASDGLQTVTNGFKDPRAAIYALNISDGDPELLREGRHGAILRSAPGLLPTLAPVNWQLLPATFTSGVITASTTGLAPGVYRMRLAAADAGKRIQVTSSQNLNVVPAGAGFRGDFYVVIAASPHSLDIYTEKRRRVYFRGESIPATILVRSTATLLTGRAVVRIARDPGFSSSGSVSIPEVKTENRRIPISVATRDLAPGKYTMTVEHAGMSASWPLEIVDPVGPSVISISENDMTLPFSTTILGSAFGWPGPDALAHGLEQPYADLQVTTFRDEMIQEPDFLVNQKLADTLEAVHAGPAPERIGVYDLRQLWMDGMTRLRMGFWAGVQCRSLSFSKANTLPGTEDEIRRTEVQISHDYQAWANYLGPQVDVDPCAVEGSGQLSWIGLPDPLVKAFRARVTKAQDAALRAQHPRELAAAGTNPAALRPLWDEWYRGVWARADVRDKAALELLSPTILRTANREYHHGPVSTGHYAPDMYRELDVHHLEAWGDPCDNILLADSWANMGAAARRASGRTDQPLWVESQSYFHDTPGFMQTRWWGALANGADGVGYAANVFGLRGWSGIEPHRANFRRQTAATMAEEVRTLGPALRLLDRERRVAILFSKTECDSKGGDGQYNVQCLDTFPPYSTFLALTMAGYQPDFILDEQVLQGDLDRYQVLYMTWQENAMSPAMKAAVDRFVAHGGKLVLDVMSNAKLYPAALRVEVNPFLFTAPHGGGFGWKWVDESVPKLRAVIDPLITPLPGRVAHPRCVVNWLHRGDGCHYAVVINEGYAPIETTLALTKPMAGYDLMTGRHIDPTTSIHVDLRNISARIYAFTPAPVASLAVRATARARAGDSVAMTASLLGDDGKPMEAIAPAIFRITNARGEVCWERWTPIGQDTPPAIWETAASEEPGQYTATITELLSGKTATFPIRLRGGNIHSPIVETTDHTLPQSVDRRALGKLWSTQATAWSVVLKANQAQLAPLADELVASLRRRGIQAQVWHNPETIPMPVGYLFTAEQQTARDRVFAGDVIGERYYANTKEAPLAPTWEPQTGTAISRNVIIFEEGAPSGIRIGWGEFSGDHNAVFLSGQDVSELRSVIRQALALKPTDEKIGPDAGREALAHGYLIGDADGRGDSPSRAVKGLHLVTPKLSEQPITWAEQIGRPVLKIDISPDSRNILATHEGLFNVIGQFTADGAPVRTLVRNSRADQGDDVRGIDNAGTIAIEVDAYHHRPLLPSGAMGDVRPAPLWESADGRQVLRYEPYTVEEKDAQGKPEPVTKRKLIRQHGAEVIFSSTELGDLPGTLYPSPNGKYLFQADDGKPNVTPLYDRFATMYDGQTGKLLWKMKSWLVYKGIFSPSIAWSADGEDIAFVRNYPNGQYQGYDPEQYLRCMIDLVRASDGEVLAEGAPTTWVEKMMVSADGRAAIGVPAFMADHYWLLEAGKEMRKVTATDHWLYDVTLDAAGQQIFTLDLNGVLARRGWDGRVIWSKPLRTDAGPILGILKAIGDDVLVGSTTGRLYRVSGKDGALLWQRATTDSLDGKMIGGL